MAKGRSGDVWRHAHTLFAEGVIGDVADEQLLERFVTAPREAGEVAFEALVERHGPMVLRICRTILRDEHDAEDAFQATFLVLRARPLRSGVGPPWPVGSTGSPAVSPPPLDRPRLGVGSTNRRRPIWSSHSWSSRDGMTSRKWSTRRSISSPSGLRTHRAL